MAKFILHSMHVCLIRYFVKSGKFQIYLNERQIFLCGENEGGSWCDNDISVASVSWEQVWSQEADGNISKKWEKWIERKTNYWSYNGMFCPTEYNQLPTFYNILRYFENKVGAKQKISFKWLYECGRLQQWYKLFLLIVVNILVQQLKSLFVKIYESWITFFRKQIGQQSQRFE